jgi:hypothetical protein
MVLKKEVRIRGKRVKQEKNQTYFHGFKTKLRRRAPPDYFSLKIGESKLHKYKHSYTVAQKSVFAVI